MKKWIYGYVGSAAQWLSIGPSLTVSATGQLDAAVTAGPAGPKGDKGDVGPIGPMGPAGPAGSGGSSNRKRNVVLAYDANAKGWRLPAGAANVTLHVNGLRFLPGPDYTISTDLILAVTDNMQPGFTVVADFDGQ